jgi:hypothetical protein
VSDEEQLVAEQVVSLEDHHALTVRISQHQSEEFWRVEVTNPSAPRGLMNTTVAPGDSFLMNLIDDAVSGQQIAWRHLAQWGRTNLAGPVSPPPVIRA